ncbi:hypothetical protein EMPG_12338 [Blastomyces silverae]|uniref:Uncharacterized protein n=1 Tax=Blastomyces silverae TaxID=2060906 RepID=A0A0H1BUB5_9EURO|nr:hypothetical protein EMPG_12338 [Blastomyces silverae]
MSMSKLIHQNYIYKQLIYRNNYIILIISSDYIFSFTVKLNNNDIYKMKKSVTFRDLIQFTILNNNFKFINILQIKDDIILTLSERSDIKIIKLIIIQ